MTIASPLAADTAGFPIGGRSGGEPVFQRGPLRPVALASTRTRISAAALARAFGSLDTVIIAAAVVVAAGLTRTNLLRLPFGEVLPALIGSGAALGLLSAARVYAFTQRERLTAHLAKVAGVLLCASMIAALIGLVIGARALVTSTWSGTLAVALLSAHTGWWLRVQAWRAAGRMTPNIVVVGATENARKLIQSALLTREVAVLGVFDDRLSRSPGDVSGVPVLGDTTALLAHPLLPYVDRIVITVAPSAQARVRDLIDRLRLLPNAVTLFMDVDGAEARTHALSRLANTSLAQVSGPDQNERRAFAKRVQDVSFGTLALLVAAPVMALVALAVRLDSPGPIFFRQRRHGFNNEAITVWKFRSMRAEAADATAARQVSANDDRVTRIGRVIRKLSLDELPQLFNVLTGEMSLVGPRPHAIGMKTEGQDSARLVAEYAWRHRMKPGLTGWAQINGSIGAVDTPEAVRRRVALDVEYIESQSFWFDLYILAATIPALIRARNVVR